MKNIFLKYKPYLLYLLFFTIAFLLIKAFFLYLLPFIISISVSFLMYPVYSYMKKRLSFKPAFSATVITLFIFSILIAVFIFVFYLLINESVNLYQNNIELFNKYLKSIDFSNLLSELNIDSDMFSKLSNTAFSIVKIVPLSITLIIISFVSTVCFINNIPKIKNLIISRLTENNAESLNRIIDKTNDIFKKFVRSYLFLYLLTFVESIFVFSLIKLDYILVFAFLATVSDLLPIFGPGTVYIPIAIIKIITGDFLSGITLIIFWAIVLIVRQIIEPKIVSDTIKIHPLVIFSALYFSIVSSNIWVFFYILSITVVYKILIESFILKPIFASEK